MSKINVYRHKLSIAAGMAWLRLRKAPPVEMSVTVPAEELDAELTITVRPHVSAAAAPPAPSANGHTPRRAADSLLPFFLSAMERSIIEKLLDKGALNADRLAELTDNVDSRGDSNWEIRGALVNMVGRGMLCKNRHAYQITDQFKSLAEKLVPASTEKAKANGTEKTKAIGT